MKSAVPLLLRYMNEEITGLSLGKTDPWLSFSYFHLLQRNIRNIAPRLNRHSTTATMLDCFIFINYTLLLSLNSKVMKTY